MDIKKLINTSLNGDEMLFYNPDSVLCKYTDLYIYNNIDDVFGHLDKIILLYLTKSETSGHWTCLYRQNNKINFFDSYGLNIDDELNYISPYKKNELHEKYRYLKHLLDKSNYEIEHNIYKLQGEHSQCCGRYVSLRLINNFMDNDEFYNIYFHNKNKSNDNIICELINI